MESYRVVLREVDAIRSSEEVDDVAVGQLALLIERAAVWIAPMPIDEGTGLIMDGNHRRAASELLGLKYLPCVPLSYADPRVSVAEWSTGKPFGMERILTLMRAPGQVFPYKTTRHSFRPALPCTAIKLAWLRGENADFTDGMVFVFD